MTNRITGLATGLDVDSLVSAELAGYKSKITKQEQQKAILGIQQEMYRGVIKQGADFFDKYLNLGKSNSLLSASSYTATTFTSSNENAVTAESVSGAAIKDNYKIEVQQLAEPAHTVLDVSNFNGIHDNKVTVKVGTKTVTIDLSSVLTSGKDTLEKNKNLATALNNNLSSLGLKATYSEISGGVILETKETGENQSFSIVSQKSGKPDINVVPEVTGKDSKFTISSSTSAVKSFKKSSNNVTLDGIKFSFSSTTDGQPVLVKGKTDADATVDRIYDFFQDYNSMLTDFQTLLNDKHDRDYSPLTEEQKSAMTDSQVTKWEEKVKKGQLHNDSILQSFVSQMRLAFSSKTAELKEIGITTTKNYDSKAGTFQIDKEKLKTALEKDPEAVMKIFAEPEKTKMVKGEEEVIAGSGGVFVSLKNVLNDNTISITKSSLIAKAGTEIYNSNATITKQITKYAKEISKMQSTLATKEQKLYSKYANLEKIMNSYNNQLAQMQSYFK